MTGIVVDATFRKLWADGVPSVEIARRYGCKSPAVNRVAKRAGLPPRGGKAKVPGRDEDEAVLSWLAMVRDGLGWEDIAVGAGKTGQTVMTACLAVRAADLAESGEPERAVARGYW